MSASIDKVIAALSAYSPPPVIWQEAFEEVEGYHERLCNLKGSPPDGMDLVYYGHDISFLPLQPDLFRYLLPICLQAWRDHLFAAGSSQYTQFVQSYFSSGMSSRTDLPELLGTQGYLAFMEFMRDSIIDRMDVETEMSEPARHTNHWWYALGTYASTFPTLDVLWRSWWDLDTIGRAVTAMHCLFVFMYEKNRVPLSVSFDLLSAEGGLAYNGWRRTNIDFIKETLSVSYLRKKLMKAEMMLKSTPEENYVVKLVSDFDKQEDVLELHLIQLPKLLANPYHYDKWL